MIGQTVSHYKILEKLGEGGMGEVYLAEDSKLERKVALNFLPRHLTANKEARERFEREAQAAGAAGAKVAFTRRRGCVPSPPCRSPGP